MMLIEETPISDAGLPVEAFKAHLRLGSGFGPGDIQDGVLVSFLRAAVAAVEGRTGKILLRRTFSQSLTEWRSCESQPFVVAPVAGVVTVEKIARDGQRTVIDPATYWVERDMQMPKLRTAGSMLPAVPEGGSVVITFEAGFDAAWDGVPADLRQAVLMLAAHYYEYRNDTGLSTGCMPFGVTSLIERYKHIRIGTGAGR
ncbi:putative GTA protein [Sulfitobacter noctilucicola]|uniref:Putative phiE125 gp8 family phage protein n=1 Tax=Sulfitobacter noctilucicola TaxID=1342301 RepID=A0A7W6MCD1_9RHOB|nr:head-tail connector protein [Sulfitobacter noctilucicola]KIN66301.1 putative GTA protein [Sulfitobacter noctilucicola]MBB4175652.1 putative phiE125 gp8 family phage protein [Sulfitobacter noctilucicola]